MGAHRRKQLGAAGLHGCQVTDIQTRLFGLLLYEERLAASLIAYLPCGILVTPVFLQAA